MVQAALAVKPNVPLDRNVNVVAIIYIIFQGSIINIKKY
jgi:hypothetical protein